MSIDRFPQDIFSFICDLLEDVLVGTGHWRCRCRFTQLKECSELVDLEGHCFSDLGHLGGEAAAGSSKRNKNGRRSRWERTLTVDVCPQMSARE